MPRQISIFNITAESSGAMLNPHVLIFMWKGTSDSQFSKIKLRLIKKSKMNVKRKVSYVNFSLKAQWRHYPSNKILHDTHVTHFLGLIICNYIQNRKQGCLNTEKKSQTLFEFERAFLFFTLLAIFKLGLLVE